MPNISLDYEKIEATSGRLDGAVRDILPMLESLRSDVGNLLEDGLVFQQSSPAMKESYDKFNTSLLAAMKASTTSPSSSATSRTRCRRWTPRWPARSSPPAADRPVRCPRPCGGGTTVDSPFGYQKNAQT